MNDFSRFVYKDTEAGWEELRQKCLEGLVPSDMRGSSIVKALGLENVPLDEAGSVEDKHLWIDFNHSTDLFLDLSFLVPEWQPLCIARDILKPATMDEIDRIEDEGGIVNVAYRSPAQTPDGLYTHEGFPSGFALFCPRCYSTAQASEGFEFGEDIDFDPFSQAVKDCPACDGSGYWDLEYFSAEPN
ncbi:MAG: hypothetical protein RL140_298 [Actinomycetota bacterium]|jgi:hypothetical protein